MLQELAKHINTDFPFLKDKKLLIAISGGLDSVVLTHLLAQLKYDISLAHCNFQLRNEASNLDEVFVENLGKKLKTPVFSIQFDTLEYAKKQQLSTQLSARKLRYDWFEKLSENHAFDYVLTAHHADDNLETFLINLTRGTGLDGLTGIPAVNGNIVRPLLKFSRAEIQKYALENNIKWREDASNAETKYVRNKIRHQIIPVLKELNPSLLKTHQKTTDFLQQSQEIVTDKIQEITAEIITKETKHGNDFIKINIAKLVKLSNPKIYLYQLLKNYKFTAWNDVYNLMYAQSGKKIITKTHTLLKNRNFLILSSTNKTENTTNQNISINKNIRKITNPIQLVFENISKKIISTENSIIVAENLLNYPLYIRTWKTGDYFYPKGMTGKKKVSKYFKDEKLSVFDKNNTWLLCTADNQIIWIIGKRQDRRFLSNEKTTKLVRITN
ncbi:tRNA lysidine(34) synthetase TilS [Tenacibaculum piscium]|uniref:tRNA lysidine(34) synthetase TilS n=1 Tax=Tenacibaculum piscium TaxID=1458515 RepID=UPI001EFB2F1B|nr:tRNA lysidine(34) synthetase TilS [Tenacibaculum piscium]MCG8182959.1 tRNA lysidine(34) synthetase TilS [Tenacibaculum piscium]MCG8204351.1 tRNA lysidine(34) synthetase TilS [Tenacibaculum piscium]